MKTAYASAIVLALSAVAAGQAFASPDPYGEIMSLDTSPAITAPAKTRAQVLAELSDAQRTGNIVANIDGNKQTKLNQVYAGLYGAAQPAVASKTREEARAELSEARRTGDITVAAGSAIKQSQFLEQDAY